MTSEYNSGSAVRFSNGGSQVSYDTIPTIEQLRTGDPVRMCLVSIPKGCPKGDDRGREYKTTNLRTHKTWRLPDSPAHVRRRMRRAPVDRLQRREWRLSHIWDREALAGRVLSA